MIDQTAEKALKAIKGYEGEIYVVRSVINAAYIDGSKISNAETKIDTGMSVRLSDKGKLGRSSVTVNDDRDIGSCISMAEQISRFSPPTKDFKGYAMPSAKKVTPKGIWDKKIENIQPKDLTDIAVSIINACDTDIPRGLIRVSAIESALMNTNGVDVKHRSTMLYAHFTSMARLEHPGEGIEACYGTRLEMDAAKIGGSLSQKAVSAASAKPFKGRKKLTMILPPCELGDMMMSSAGSALNGENVLYGRSPWKDGTGKAVASDNITLTDDPMSPAPLCSSFDDEGTPACKKTLVENGTLRSFIRDGFVGESTGNGMRRSSVESQGIYENPVSIKPMNLVLSPGRYSMDEIISQTKDGILVDKFAWPECDSLTGRFGLEVRSGHLIKNGRITETINSALMMGNMITALKNVEFVGNDPKNMGCVTIPTVSFADIELIGN